MKKTYETPSVEKVAFQYRDQVVVASGTFCGQQWTGYGNSNTSGCRYVNTVRDSGM